MHGKKYGMHGYCIVMVCQVIRDVMDEENVSFCQKYQKLINCFPFIIFLTYFSDLQESLKEAYYAFFKT